MNLPDKSTKYTEGQAAAVQVIAAQGKAVATAMYAAALPAGQPCRLTLEDWRYWTGFKQATEAAP